MPADHPAQAGGEPAGVRGAGQPEGEGDVVGGAARFQLVQKPQALLGEGERQLVFGRPERPRERDERRRREPQAARQLQVGQGGETGHRRRLEHRLDRQLHPERLPHPRDQPGGQERVPAELEETVVEVDPRGLDPQHLGPDPRHDLLGRGARRRHRARLGRDLEGRQGPPVHLAVGVERQRVEHQEPGGHHVLRQALAQIGAELRHRQGIAPRPRRHVGDQPLLPALLAHEHRGLLDRRMGGERRLDLPRLDAEAADLHLRVDPPQELDRPWAPSRRRSAPGPPSGRAARPGCRTGSARSARRSAPAARGSPGPGRRRPRRAPPEPRPAPATLPGRGREPCCWRSGRRWRPSSPPRAPPLPGARC